MLAEIAIDTVHGQPCQVASLCIDRLPEWRVVRQVPIETGTIQEPPVKGSSSLACCSVRRDHCFVLPF